MPKVIKGMPRWRSDELEILRQMAPQKTNAQLAEILVGRSLDSIACKISSPKLRGKHRNTPLIRNIQKEPRYRVRTMMDISARIAQLKRWKREAA